MGDEVEQIILADTASSVVEEPPMRRGIFGRPRRSKLPAIPLTHCENCSAPLTGEFCGQCGQHAIDYRRSLFRVLLDAADSFLNWDTKFLHTMNVLLTRPWKLTNDFNAGRRVRYVHPLRLYLIASIVFFLMAKAVNLDSKGPIQLSAQDRADLVASLGRLTGPDSSLTQEQREKVEVARLKLSDVQGVLTERERDELREAFRAAMKSSLKKSFKPEERGKMAAAIARIPEVPTPPEVLAELPPDALARIPPRPKKDGPIHFTVGPEDGKKSWFETWMEGRIKEKIGEDGTKSRLFLDTLRSNIPAMMLCCVPLFAFVLKVLYIRQRRFYVEHLVYALHIHSFLYVGVVVTALFVMAANRLAPNLGGIVGTLLACAIFVLIFLSIRRVYRQGWFFTAVKFLAGGLVYSVILILAVGTTAFVTLLLP